MSTGRFVRGRYESNDGDIYAIRVQPETATATVGGVVNAFPAGAVDQTITVKTSLGKRQFGLRPRSITFAWNEGAAPAGYDERTLQKLVIFQESVFDAIDNNEAVSYQGGTGTVVSKSPEQER